MSTPPPPVWIMAPKSYVADPVNHPPPPVDARQFLSEDECKKRLPPNHKGDSDYVCILKPSVKPT